MHGGKEYLLDHLTHQEGKLFLWMMKEYLAAASWTDFQESTAKPILEAALKVQKLKRREDDKKFKWEDYLLYGIRSDLLRNVGIKSGELKGELSDMLI